MSSPPSISTGLVAHMRGSIGTNRANEASDSGVVRPVMVYVGTDQYPVSLIQLSQVLNIAWKNKAVLNVLKSTVSSLLGSHNGSNLITLVDGAVPMYT